MLGRLDDGNLDSDWQFRPFDTLSFSFSFSFDFSLSWNLVILRVILPSFSLYVLLSFDTSSEFLNPFRADFNSIAFGTWSLVATLSFSLYFSSLESRRLTVFWLVVSFHSTLFFILFEDFIGVFEDILSVKFLYFSSSILWGGAIICEFR